MNQNQSIEDLIRQSQSGSPSSANLASTADDKLQEKMHQIDLKEQERKTRQKADELGLNYMSLHGYPIGPETIAVFPEAEARANSAVAFYESGGRLRLGLTDPAVPTLQDLVRRLGQKYPSGIELFLISPDSLAWALKQYGRVMRPKAATSDVEVSQADIARFRAEITDFGILNDRLQGGSLTETFNMILAAAINAGSSDIHIEAGELDIVVRFRIDGVLSEVARMPRDNWPKVISRIKLMARLKMNINTIPQDGRITVVMDKEKIDVRVSTLPTAYGESVVLRLLHSSATALAYDQLGVRGRAYDELKRQIQRPNGMIITTGPTGSGKTTTLYAILNQLNNPEAKIVTLEDPIEYKLTGISQSQIDPSRDYTFAKGLRAILRQDPDIVMVGEIRDAETTEIAIQAALTGHLVLSTVHTNSAAGAIPRLLALSAKPFLLAPALNAILAQRLVRRICPNCKTEYHPTSVELERVKKTLAGIPADSGYAVNPDQLKFFHGSGCEQCQHLGLKGQIGIYEVIIMSPEIEKIILSDQVSEYTIQDTAVKNGMITMAQDGLLKALDGMTTIDEVFRVAE